MDDLKKGEKMEIKLKHDGSTKRFERYVVDHREVKGALYFPRGSEVPGQITLTINKDDESERGQDEAKRG